MTIVSHVIVGLAIALTEPPSQVGAERPASSATATPQNENATAETGEPPNDERGIEGPPLFLRVTCTLYGGDRDPTVAEELRQRLTDAFIQRGADVRNDAEMGFEIEVTWSGEGDGGRYLVKIDFETKEHERTGAAPMTSYGYYSTPDELVERVGNALLEGYEHSADPRPVVPPPEVEPDGRKPPAEQKPHRRRLEPLGYVGVGLGLGGLGMAVFGGVSMALGQRPWVATEDARWRERDNYRSWKTDVVLYTGLGAMALGLTMVALDLADVEKRRRTRAQAVSIIPIADLGFVGLAVRGTFRVLE